MCQTKGKVRNKKQKLYRTRNKHIALLIEQIVLPIRDLVASPIRIVYVCIKCLTVHAMKTIWESNATVIYKQIITNNAPHFFFVLVEYSEKMKIIFNETIPIREMLLFVLFSAFDQSKPLHKRMHFC